MGWGIQFQQPIFLLFLIFILIIFSLNLFDTIEFNLPNKFNTNINKYLDRKSSSAGFFGGALATLLATPCSAPFLGTAVSFALSSNFYTTLLIFIFLGFGMSIPYFIFILFPTLINILPKPGKWMNYLKYILGIGLILTALWLSYVCVSITGLSIFIYAISALALFLLIFFRLYLIKKYLILILIIILGNIYISYNADYFDYDFSNSNQEEWLNFDNLELQNLISQGNTVFVDITADWCITCKANKILVLNSKEFKRLIRENKIILMKGDWTKPNDEINKFLQNADRYGIPFNALYNFNFPNGLLYSEILSLEDIKESLTKLHSSNAK